ncbi:MAG: hypothetical protein AAF696_38560, partial [Bacteroidota bacterium]
MKHKAFLHFLVFIFFIQNGIGQNFQHRDQYQAIATLGKIWGFLKYHHPNVSRGKVDWDEVWFQHLEMLSDRTKQEEFFNVYQSLYDAAGFSKKTYPRVKAAKHPWEVRNIDQDWLNDSLLMPAELCEKLSHLALHPYQGRNYWVQRFIGAGNPKFHHEKIHNRGALPSLPIR